MTQHSRLSRVCPHCQAEYSPRDYDTEAPEWLCSTCKGLLPRQQLESVDAAHSSDPDDPTPSTERIRLFCNAQREPYSTNTALHMPAIVMGLLFGMIKQSFLMGIAVLIGVEVLIGLVALGVNAGLDRAFAFRRVRPWPYRMRKGAQTINAQLAEVQNDTVFLRVTEDPRGLKGNIVPYSKNDFCDADVQYIDSIAHRVSEANHGSPSAASKQSMPITSSDVTSSPVHVAGQQPTLHAAYASAPQATVTAEPANGGTGADHPPADVRKSGHEVEPARDLKDIESLASSVFGNHRSIFRSLFAMGPFLWFNLLMIAMQVAGVAAIFSVKDWNPIIVLMLIAGGAVFAFIQVSSFIMHLRLYLRLRRSLCPLTFRQRASVVISSVWSSPGLLILCAVSIVVWRVVVAVSQAAGPRFGQ